jgi:endonuclease/exonuclease/phosphatase family metal-dependent hydrolase
MANKEQTLKRRRPVLALLAIVLLILYYRFLTVYTVRSGECRPNPIDPNLHVLTRTVNGAVVSYPARMGFPRQQRPLLVMSYNIDGHAELIDGSHIQKIAAAINRIRPDIVGLQEVHRNTWQSRFRDQLGELEAATGMHGWFAPSLVQWGGEFGNAILTRGSIVHAVVHQLPSVGEPRTLIESVIDIDGTRLNFYVTHLTTWGNLNANNRGEQLDCVARQVRASRYPYILTGDFNNGQDAAEVQRFIRSNAAQICGLDIGITHPILKKRIDYIFADWGWTVVSARTVPIGPSDHWPVTAELLRGN